MKLPNNHLVSSSRSTPCIFTLFTRVFPSVVLFFLLLFGPCTVQSFAVTNTYTGATGGDWESDGNWDQGHAPLSTEDVVIDANKIVHINEGTTINSLTLGPTATSTLNFDYDAQGTSDPLIITSGDLTVNANGNITHTAGTASVVGTIYITVTSGDAEINGTINTDGKGYAGASGNSAGSGTGGGGAGGNARGGGGGYGGAGGDGDASGGTTYGSSASPTYLGSGGGGSNDGGQTAGAGGGAILLSVAGTLTINGTVSAIGADGTGPGDSCWGKGGGAGGSIFLIAHTVTGTGTIYAYGGHGSGGNCAGYGGGGGGGRVAIYYGLSHSWSGTALTATVATAGGVGGTNGGSGTVVVRYNGSAPNIPALATYWKLDEGQGATLNDSTVQNWNMGSSGSPTWKSDDQCVWGKCLSFDGSNDYAYNAVSTNLQNTKQVTIEFWLKLPSFDTSGSRAMEMTSDYTAVTDGFYITPNSTISGKIQFGLKGNGGVTDATFAQPSAGSWHHYVFILDKTTGANTLAAYVDGVSQTLTYLSRSDNTNVFANDTLYLMSKGGSSLFLKGFLDEVRLFNYTRSATQILGDLISRGVNEGTSVNFSSPAHDFPSAFSNGLSGYWTLDEASGTSASDISGNANTGTDTSTTVGAAGKFGFARTFNGSSSYIDAGNGASVQITGALSMSAWIRLTNSTAVHDIVAKKGSSGNYGYRLFTDTNGKVNIEVSGDGTTTTVASGAATLENSTWYHVVGVYNPSKSLSVYVNGKLDGYNTTSIPSSIYNSSANVTIGAENGGTTNYMTGSIDEVRLYASAVSSSSDTQLLTGSPPPVSYGTGADGAITVSDSKNINTDAIQSGHACADGGDGVTYSVTALTSTTAQLSTTPASGCLSAGDEILLINLQGISTNYGNVGNYETLRIASVSTDTVTFASPKTKYYGNGTNSDDTNLGTATTNQRVMLQRVPNYTNVTVSNGGTLTATAWGGAKGGVVIFRANGTVSVASGGSISVTGKGYRGGATTGNSQTANQGEGVGGVGSQSTTANINGGAGGGNVGSTYNEGGGGGGHGAVGTYGRSYSAGGTSILPGGDKFGTPTLTTLFMGGGGGAGSMDDNDATAGAIGGGIIYIVAPTLSNAGTILANGNDASNSNANGGGGAGAGGSLFIKGTSITLGSALTTASGGTAGTTSPTCCNPGFAAGGNGAVGRIAIEYSTFLSGTTTPAAKVTQQGATIQNLSVQKLYAFVPEPILYWNMNESGWTNDCSSGTILDTSINGNNGKACPSSTGPTGGATGIFGKSGILDGSNDYLITPNMTSLNSTNASFTIEAWFYPTTANGVIVTELGTAAVNSATWHAAWIELVSGSLKARVWNCTALTLGSVTTNTWNHVALTYTSGTIAGYLNGVYTSGTCSRTVPSSVAGSEYFGIGATDSTNNGSGAYFTGKVDEFKIYNYVRTKTQVVQDMNASHPAPGSPIGSAVGYWKMDEGVDNTCSGSTNDVCNSGSGGTALDLAQSGTPLWTANGKFDKALTFSSGASQYLTASGNPTGLQITSDLTISAWVNLSNNNAVHDIVAKKGASGSYGYRLYTDANGKLNMEVSSDGTAITTVTGATTLSNNRWHYVSGVYNQADTSMTVYLNGKQDGQNLSAPASIYNNSTTNLNIGAENGGTTNYMSGSIDEVKVYSAALSADQIKADMNKNATQVLGSLSDTSGLTGGSTASTSAAAAYCVPGDTTSCAPPIAEWNLDENTGSTVYDRSGNGRNATITAGLGGFRPGKFGSAYNFDKNNSVIATNATFAEPTEITVMAWIYPRTRGEGDDGAVVNFSTGSLTAMRMGGNSGQERIQWRQNFDDTNGLWQSPLGSIVTNRWNHVVITYNTSSTVNTPSIYINGIPQTVTTSITPIGTAVTAAQTWRIGNSNDTSTTFDGLIDEVKVFDYIRSPAQIAWDFNRGRPVGWWKFDENSGTTAYDASLNGNETPNGNTGTLTLGPSYTTGKINYGINFDGSNDYVTITDPSSDILDPNYITVGAWIKSNNVSSLHYIISKHRDCCDSPGLGGYGIRTNANGTLRGELWRTSTQTLLAVDGTKVLTTGTWYHIAMVFTGTNILLYINGQLDATSSTIGADTIQPTAKNLVIGMESFEAGTNNWYPFSGIIDDVRIYNYPMTATQIKQWLNDGAAVRFAPVTGTP